MDYWVLEGVDFLYTFVDDVIIASSSVSLHKQHLEQVFQRFNQFGISINVNKCVFGEPEIEFLG